MSIKGSHAPMLFHSFQICFVVQLCVYIAGTNGVASYAVRRPFRCLALAQVDNAGFGCVVRALLLWVEDADAGDGAKEDDGAGGLVVDHGAGAGGGDKLGFVRTCLLVCVSE